MAAPERYHYGLGRRKEAVATARLYSANAQELVVNDQPAETYFNNTSLIKVLQQPLELAGQTKLRVTLRVSGGGKHGQAEAARLAIARALRELNQDLHPTLRKAGFMTRDPREKERKKPGLKRARKAPQFSKR